MKIAVFFMSLLMVARAAPAAGAAKVEDTVVVRTYDYANISPDQIAEAREEAEQIFKHAHIAVQWIDCRVPGRTSGEPCTEPLTRGRDLMLRLVDQTPANAVEAERLVALGESIVDRDERGGVLMTVDLFRVGTIARGTATRLPVLLGRAIAHEIGHLLLGTPEHARYGLMRALWSHDELRGAKPANWGFSSREAAHMRQALRGRARTAD